MDEADEANDNRKWTFDCKANVECNMPHDSIKNCDTEIMIYLILTEQEAWNRTNFATQCEENQKFAVTWKKFREINLLHDY